MSSDRPGIEPARYAVTALAIGLAIGLRYIQIPGLHLELLGADPIRNAVGQLGIVSIIEAFIVVEVLVAIVPRWRKYRNLGAERRGLVRPTVVLSIAFVSLQAVFFARELENIATVSAVAYEGTYWVTVLCLVGATFLLWVSAMVVSRWGIGNGYSILLAIEMASSFQLPERGLLSHAIVSAGIGLIFVAGFLRFERIGQFFDSKIRVRAGDPELEGIAWCRLPACGLAPFVFLGAIASAVAIFSKTEIFQVAWIYRGVLIVLAIALAWLFNRPSVVQSNFMRIHPTKQAPPMQLGKASLVSAAMLLALSEFSRWSSETFNIEISMLAIPTVTAVAIDLVQEIRFRLSNKAPVTVVELHQPHSVSAIIKRLSDEGIRGLPRAVCHRTLLQFFGPHIPITLLVSADDLASARAVVQTLDA